VVLRSIVALRIDHENGRRRSGFATPVRTAAIHAEGSFASMRRSWRAARAGGCYRAAGRTTDRSAEEIVQAAASPVHSGNEEANHQRGGRDRFIANRRSPAIAESLAVQIDELTRRSRLPGVP